MITTFIIYLIKATAFLVTVSLVIHFVFFVVLWGFIKLALNLFG